MSIATYAKALLCLLICSKAFLSADVPPFSLPPSIPVVNMQDFHQSETKQKFIDDVAKALHEVGFFAVINPGMEMNVLEDSYKFSIDFFRGSQEQKLEIHRPNLNGQRGYVFAENAQGNIQADYKEFVHIGRTNNVWPLWMDFESPMMSLLHSLDKHSEDLQRAFASAIGEEENFLIDMTKDGDCLLRTIHYPATEKEGQIWAAAHTDIDFFTILPLSTEDGLQILHKGEWIDVRVPPNAFIVNGGDMLENLTNGYFKSSFHRVISKPGAERFSIVYFIHPKAEDAMNPTSNSIALTGGVQRFPNCTRLEQLARRLCEIGLANADLVEYDKRSGYIDRIRDLVEEGVAADPVKLTYEIWTRDQLSTEK